MEKKYNIEEITTMKSGLVLEDGPCISVGQVLSRPSPRGGVEKISPSCKTYMVRLSIRCKHWADENVRLYHAKRCWNTTVSKKGEPLANFEKLSLPKKGSYEKT